MLPLTHYINDAKAQFQAHYGIPAERLHASRLFERALQRWAAKNLDLTTPTYDGAEIAGLELLQSTKKYSPHFEFWLSATRSGQVLSLHLRLEPTDLGLVQTEAPTIILGTDDRDFQE